MYDIVASHLETSVQKTRVLLCACFPYATNDGNQTATSHVITIYVPTGRNTRLNEEDIRRDRISN